MAKKAGDSLRPVTLHRLMIKDQYVRPILEGKMRYQVRYDDRGYQAGDEIVFSVYSVDGKTPLSSYAEEMVYSTEEEVRSIESNTYRVDHVMTFEGLASGYVVFTITLK